MGIHHYRGATSAPASILLGVHDRSPARLERSLRQAVEGEIERLIDMLDALEPDADLEPYLAGNLGEMLDDREADAADEGELDDCDDEDSDHSGAADYEGLLEQEKGEGSDLGATADIDQEVAWALPEWKFASGGHPVNDGEPSLGWSENHGGGFNEHQADSPRDDREDDAGDNREQDDAELGIADMGGLEDAMGRAN